MLCLTAVLAMILAAAAPLVTYSADISFGYTVEQFFETSSSTANDEFTYRLKPLDGDNPMPAGSTAEGYTFTISGNDSVEIGPMADSRQGVFKYELYQVIDGVRPGYSYDDRIYTIEAYVSELKGVSIFIFNGDREKADDLEFENGYNANPTDPLLMVDPPVKKTVTGSPDKNGVFTFKLVAQNVPSPMPPGSVGGVKTLQILGAGEEDFGVWSYTEEGVYSFKVYEVNSKESGYTYDTEVYTITDTVSDVKGQLVLSRKVTNAKNRESDAFAFNNNYTRPATTAPGSPAVSGNAGVSGSPVSGGKGVMPKTGDYMNTVFYIALVAVSGIVVVCLMVYLLVARKRRREEDKQ